MKRYTLFTLGILSLILSGCAAAFTFLLLLGAGTEAVVTSHDLTVTAGLALALFIFGALTLSWLIYSKLFTK